ncbi:MAG TPA: adenylate cyclase regulatory domain-containing protein [Solirubrobacteraceae bacterium]|jgi:adenylate cyclase
MSDDHDLNPPSTAARDGAARARPVEMSGGDPAARATHARGGRSDHDVEPPSIDFAAEGLLDGLDEPHRLEREALLRKLAADGVPLAELKRSSNDGTILFLAAERVLSGGRRYTAAQISELTGVDLEFLVAVRRAMGMPIPATDEALYTEDELESVRMTSAFGQAGVSEEEILELTRVLGRGLSQAAEAMRAVVLRLVLEPGVSEQELAQRYATATAELSPMLGPLIANLLTLHLRQMAQGEAINAAERSGGQLPGSREVAIGFADLVGFTRLGEEVAPEELGRLSARLEIIASEVIEPPVRLVKTIGDAVMLASTDSATLLHSLLTLIDAADADGEELPQLRAGAALGPALSRAGDWFGRPVNLASRITAIARPGSVLVDRELREGTHEDYRWSYAGTRRLRGIREPVALYRARRPLPA